ncbi:hypothetical protein SK128_025042 [Halocaridina rubra]|uniref:Serum response factor-binding protein 1 n=1 Tax=Halocaridina rubra TaxID=373956 RepID=A0AAN8WGJ7_HALRR
MATTTQEGLTKLTLNNFIVKNRQFVRQGRIHVIRKNVARAKELRQWRVKDEKEREKFNKRADKFIEEVEILKKFSPDDMLKFALLNKKSLTQVTNDVSSSIEERALCRLATWKTVIPVVTKFRELYPNWEEKLPLLIKNIGLNYRRKRLKRLERKGQKEIFLEKEHKNLQILQELTHIEVDPHLIAKAKDLMQISQKNKKKEVTSKVGKNSIHDKIGKMEHKKGLEKQEIKGKERSGDHVGKAPSEKSLAVESNEEQYRLTKKSIRKVKKSLENNEANLNVKSNSVICDSRIGSTLQETSLGDSMASDSEVEGISDGGSSVHYAFIGGQKAAKASIDAEEDMIDKDEFSDGKCADYCKKGKEFESECIKNENPTEFLNDDETISSENDMNDYESDYSESDSASESDENESESDAYTSAKLVKKLKRQSSVSSVNFDSESDSDDIEDMKNLSENEGKKLRTVTEYDSEGVSGSESGTGSEFEITSIWDSAKENENRKKNKKLKDIPKNSDTANKLLANNINKRKGTAVIKQINLTEAESIDLAPQGSDNENPTSDSEIEDFFIRDPVDKGKKEHKFKNETDLDEIKCSDDENSDDSDLDGNIEAVSRFQYLNENFKRIWGMGTEETIKHSLSRRGTGRGRGGFVSTKGPERFRGRYDDNPNLLPLGISQSSNKDQDNPNMVPVSSDWRSKLAENNKNKNSVSLLKPSYEDSIRDADHKRNWRKRKFDNPEDSHLSPSNDFSLSRKISSAGSKFDNFPNRGRGRGRGRFDRNYNNNPNLAPVAGGWKKNFKFSAKDNQESSLLHPSWLAKQREKGKAASLHQFQGNVKKFDLDD